MQRLEKCNYICVFDNISSYWQFLLAPLISKPLNKNIGFAWMVPRNKFRFNKSTSFTPCYCHSRYTAVQTVYCVLVIITQLLNNTIYIYHEEFLWFNSPVTELLAMGIYMYASWSVWKKEGAFPVGKEYSSNTVHLVVLVIICMSVYTVQVWGSPWRVPERHQERI